MVRRLTRRSVSNLLIAGGAAVLIGAGASVARASLARETARTLWAQGEARRAVAGARLVASGRSDAQPPLRGAPIARLEIPRLELDEIVVEGVGDAELRAGPGRMTGSALPGAPGNSVISAHRDRHFRSLGGLVVGDTVITESDAGRIVWRVVTIRIVDADAPALRTADTPKLTLTTCWPIRYFGPAADRMIAEAEPITT
jgi:sortase A